MERRKLRIAFGLVVAGLLAGARSAVAVMINNGDPVGANYTIQNIDAGVMVDFVATTPDSGNKGTIGRLTAIMSHSNTLPLGFALSENAAATSTPKADKGLRLLMDVKDTNGMTGDWIDYHIHAEDNAEDVNAIRQTLMPKEDAHRIEAHFHGGPGSPLVLQGDGDNVPDLNYGLGGPVTPGNDFRASGILLHERDFIEFRREFQVTFAPSVPEPPSLALAALGILRLLVGTRRRRPARGGGRARRRPGWDPKSRGSSA